MNAIVLQVLMLKCNQERIHHLMTSEKEHTKSLESVCVSS